MNCVNALRYYLLVCLFLTVDFMDLKNVISSDTVTIGIHERRLAVHVGNIAVISLEVVAVNTRPRSIASRELDIFAISLQHVSISGKREAKCLIGRFTHMAQNKLQNAYTAIITFM